MTVAQKTDMAKGQEAFLRHKFLTGRPGEFEKMLADLAGEQRGRQYQVLQDIVGRVTKAPEPLVR